MSTTKQIDANRRNALNSGRPLGRPRSAEGKAASSANSLKTSLYARSQVIAGEDPAELRALAGQYFLRWQPATPEESFLVATLIDAEWLLRRYSLADAKIWGYKGADDCVRHGPNSKGLNFIRCREYFPLLQRRADSALRAFHRALHDLERFQSKRRAEAPPADPKPSAALPPEAKANFAQLQSDQQKIGFVPSFCPTPEPAGDSPDPVPLELTHNRLAPDPAPVPAPVPASRLRSAELIPAPGVDRLPYLIPITHVHKQRGVHVSTMRSGDLSPFGTPFPNDRANRQYREGVN
jgi:hypothetical protein